MWSVSFLLCNKAVTVVCETEDVASLLRTLLSDRAVEVRHVGTGKEVKIDIEKGVVNEV